MRPVTWTALVVALFAATASAADTADETAIKTAGLATDAPALLDFVKQRSREAVPADELNALLRDLDSNDTAKVDAAVRALVARGTLAVPGLRRTVSGLTQPSTVDRARNALAAIEGRGGSELSAAVVRTLVVRRPDGTLEALLAYLPYADDGQLQDAIGGAIGQLAFVGERPQPSILKALESPIGLLRAVAAEALTRPGHPETREAVKRLLADPSRPVRQRAAIALARAEEIAAIPVLIELTGELGRAERTAVDDVLRSIAVDTAPKSLPPGDSPAERQAVRKAWQDWWKAIDGPGLIAAFRSRTPTPAEQAQIADRIVKLGDNNFKVRERASNDLIRMGAKAVVDLRRAVQDKDTERARRAEAAVLELLKADQRRVPAGTARLAALRRAAGATEALIDFLPYADDDEAMVAEIRAALPALALDAAGRPDAALVKALRHALPICRLAAGEALAKGGGAAVRPDVHKLLADESPHVRQAVAVALAIAGERDGVPVLIDVLAVLPSSQTWIAQDLLLQLAGSTAPSIRAGDTPEDRKKVRDTWAAWWKAHERSANLAVLSAAPADLGFTLLVQVNNGSVGRVLEVGRGGEVRWEIKNLRYPVDAFLLPGDRVLITEWDGNRVAEWDTRGNVIWQKTGFNGRATNAQRLRDGNTFIATTNEVMEVDRSGKVVYQFNVPEQLTAAYRSNYDEIVALRNDGKVVRYDTGGKVLKAFNSKRDSSWTSGLDLVRGGNILVSQPSPGSKVTEYTPDGSVVREWNAPGVTTATRLPNGNILVASHGSQRAVEYDPHGRQVWEYKGDGYHIFRARRR